MKLNIVERKVNLKDSTKEKLEKKLSKFEKFFKDEAEITATFRTQKDVIYLEVYISSGDISIRAESSDTDAKAAIDKVESIIDGQFRKYKTKLEKKVKGNVYTEFYNESSSGYDEEENEFNVVKKKKFFIKPMSVDEAILQMNLIGHQFFVFINSETDETCIVYKRKDNNYGLIETD